MKSCMQAVAALMLSGPLVCALASGQQSNSTPRNFDDLSRRASAALETNPEEAVRLYREALAIRPSWAEGWFYLAATLYEKNQYDESRNAFEHAAALARDNGAVSAFLGLCEYELGDYAHALSHLRKGEALGLPDDPKFIWAVRNTAALIFLRANDFTSAVEQLQPLAKSGNNSAATIEAFGVSVLGMPHLPKNVPAGKQALVGLAGRAAWALYSESASDTAALFHELITQYPTEPGVHYFYGIYLLDIDPDAARAEFLQELRITPSHVPARQQIAILDIKAGDAKAAANLAKEALKLQPENPLSHAILGRALAHTEQWTAATLEFETAVRLAPENPQLHFSLAEAYRHAGRTSDAGKEMAEFGRLKSAQRP